jgi:RNA polymerase sigma-70 factor, ECF subfamily
MIRHVMLQTFLAGMLCVGSSGAAPSASAATDGQQRSIAERGAYRQVRRVVERHRRKGIDVDDCVQDVCVGLLQSRGQLYDRADQWLVAVARNKAVDHVRRRYRRSTESLTASTAERLVSREPEPGAACERLEVVEQVRAAMARLKDVASPRSYEVLNLRFFHGLSVPEVAERLNLTNSQVWAREHRMKAKLRQLIEADREPGADQ